MNSFEEILIEFEKYLEKKLWNFKKYEIDGAFLFDIEKTAVIFIERKVEYSKEHITLKELLNLKNEKDYTSPDIKIKPFCTKFVKEWVTFYPFNGKLEEDAKIIDEKYPFLKLVERYENWEGYRITFVGFSLEEKSEKGYALVKYPDIGGLIDLREIGKHLLGAYLNFVMDNHCLNTELVQVIKCRNNFEFIINSTMAKILNAKYVEKYSMDVLRKVKDISDLKGFWTSTFLKDKDEIPYKLFNDLEKNESIGIISDLYTDSLKLQIPKLEDFSKEYHYLSVLYADNLNSCNYYNYISEDDSVKVGDIVLVNRAGEDVVALVVSTKFYMGYETPFPVNRTKSIIKKIENKEELKKYGYTPDDFKDYYNYDEEDDDEYYIYYIVTTLCDKEEIADKISKTLMEKRLVAGSQISSVKSDYWWNGKIERKNEFKLEFRTREDKVNEIVQIITEIHDYQIPAISQTEIECATGEMKKWIDEALIL